MVQSSHVTRSSFRHSASLLLHLRTAAPSANSLEFNPRSSAPFSSSTHVIPDTPTADRQHPRSEKSLFNFWLLTSNFGLLTLVPGRKHSSSHFVNATRLCRRLRLVIFDGCGNPPNSSSNFRSFALSS